MTMLVYCLLVLVLSSLCGAQGLCDMQPCENGGTCYQKYQATRTYLCVCVEGYTGNNCEITVDITPPEILNCGSEIKQVSDLRRELSVRITPPTATDPSGIRSVTTSDNIRRVTTGEQVSDSVTVPFGGATSVEYIFTDNAGNVARCAFPVSHSSIGGPVISDCPSNQCDTQGAGGRTRVFFWDEPTASRGLLTRSHAPGSTFAAGRTTVTYTVEEAGKTSVCAFLVCLPADTTPPDVMCPGNQQATVGLGQRFAQVNYPPASATDDSDETVILEYFPAGNMFSLGLTDVRVTALDTSNNRASCTFMIEVGYTDRETTPPTVTCPPHQRETVMGQAHFVVVDYPPARATDNSDRTPMLIYSIATNTDFMVGTTYVTVTAIDLSGNRAECTFNVYILSDDIPSMNVRLICPPDQEVYQEQGRLQMQVNYPPAIVSGDLSDRSIIVKYTHDSGDLFNVSTTTTVTAQVYEPGMYKTQCTFKVTVIPAGEIIITCPILTIERVQDRNSQKTVVQYSDATAVGGQGDITLSYSIPSGGEFPRGETTVSVTGVDSIGGFSQCMFSVYVVFEESDDCTEKMLRLEDNQIREILKSKTLIRNIKNDPGLLSLHSNQRIFELTEEQQTTLRECYMAGMFSVSPPSLPVTNPLRKRRQTSYSRVCEPKMVYHNVSLAISTESNIVQVTQLDGTKQWALREECKDKNTMGDISSARCQRIMGERTHGMLVYNLDAILNAFKAGYSIMSLRDPAFANILVESCTAILN